MAARPTTQTISSKFLTKQRISKLNASKHLSQLKHYWNSYHFGFAHSLPLQLMFSPFYSVLQSSWSGTMTESVIIKLSPGLPASKDRVNAKMLVVRLCLEIKQEAWITMNPCVVMIVWDTVKIRLPSAAVCGHVLSWNKVMEHWQHLWSENPATFSVSIKGWKHWR